VVFVANSMSKQHTETSKFLSFVLRHKPEAIGLVLDAEGWADIDLLIACANESGQALTRPLLQKVVETNDKKRFTVSENGLRIRAAQGHSTQSVAIAHVEKQPPEFLYHGTATRFLDSIREQGLLPGSRHHVHLSEDEETATAVG
jgi:putative RNA 2'-phosphotransferase